MTIVSWQYLTSQMKVLEVTNKRGHIMRTQSMILALCCSLYATGFSQNSAPTKDPRATALAAQALLAMGTSASTSCTLQGNLTLSNSATTMPIVLKNSGNSKMRVELSTAKGRNVLILSDGVGAVTSPNGKVIHLSSNNTAFRRVPYLPAFSILSDNGVQTTRVEYVAAASAQPAGVALSLSSQGADADLVAQMTRTSFNIDPLSGFVTRMNYTRFGENDSNAKNAMEVHFSKYQLVDGMQVPFTQVTLADGKTESMLQLSSADCHTPIDSSEFTLPN